MGVTQNAALAHLKQLLCHHKMHQSVNQCVCEKSNILTCQSFVLDAAQLHRHESAFAPHLIIVGIT